MSWEPRFDFLPQTRFRANVKAFVEENIEAALRWAEAQAGWEGEELPAFAGVYNSRAVREEHPVLNLLPLGSDPEETDDEDWEERKRLLVEVENFGRDPDDLFAELEIYNLALRSLLTEMPEARLWQGIDQATRGDVRWTVGTERFGEREYEGENASVQVGSQVLTLFYTETEGE
jgi:hypothetical protein